MNLCIPHCAMVSAVLISAAALCPMCVSGAGTQSPEAGTVRSPAARVYTVKVSTNRADAVYAKGEEIVFRAQALENGVPVPACRFKLEVTADGRFRKTEIVDSKDGTASIRVKFDTVDWVHFSAQLLDSQGKAVRNEKGRPVTGEIGAMVAPLEIRAAGTEPADFDAFWAARRAELDKVPVKAVLQKVSINANADKVFDCWDVKVDCAGGKPVSGYLVIPKNAKAKSLPAVVSFHGAGFRSANKVCRANAVSFDVNAHGIENGRPAGFYIDLSRNELKNYWHSGKEDREKIYFKGMYLRVMRALDYIKTRPEWDGRRLAATGTSQGGAQTLVAAALDPQVTLACAGVPALSEHAGCTAVPERRNGWPQFYGLDRQGQISNPAAAKAAAYYDNVFFAKRIGCEVWISTGFIDEVCPPSGVYAVFNNLKTAKKTMEACPDMGHGEKRPLCIRRLQEYLR